MRILFVTQEFPPDTHWGGIGTYAGILTPALARVGAEVHVLSVVRHQTRKTQEWPGGVAVHRAPLTRPPGLTKLRGLRHTLHRLSLAFSVDKEVRRLRERFDVIALPSWNAEGAVIALRHEVPLVVHAFSSAHEILPLTGCNRIDRRLAIALEDIAPQRADLLTGPAPQVSALGQRLNLDETRCQPLPCPVARSTVTDPPDAPVIGFFGRFEPRKAPETLVRAMPNIRAAIPDARLILRGRDGPAPTHPSYLTCLRRLSRELDIDDAVDIIEGWDGHAEVSAAMSRCAVVAMPSQRESFGYVAAEASALGRAVVATALPALAEVIIDHRTGRLVASNDPVAWAEGVVDVLGTPGRSLEMGRNGAARMREQFDPDQVAVETLAAYEAAIRRFAADREAVAVP